MIYTLRYFSLQDAVCFIIQTYLVPVLFTFYIQSVLKLKNIILAPKCCQNSHTNVDTVQTFGATCHPCTKLVIQNLKIFNIFKISNS